MASKKIKKEKKTSSVSKPLTMADLLASAKDKVKGFSSGEKINAKVVGRNKNSLILDIGGKSEGVVAEKAFIEAKDLIKSLKPGDEVMVTVIVPEAKDGTVLLSLRHAANDAVWEKLEKYKKEGREISVKGRSASKSGLMVDVKGMYGFIPFSQMGKGYSSDLDALVDETFKAKIIELNRKANKIVLSEKEVSEAGEIKLNKEVLESIKEGEVYEGKITTVTNFGCFVRLDIKSKKGEKVDVEGLVHISEISWEKVRKVSDTLKEGDMVKVKVLESNDGRLSLSIKYAQKDPWEEAEENFKQETRFKGKVTKLSDFGVFVQLTPGVEGLIHITKIPPATKLRVGDEVDVFVEELDSKAKKISLGLVLTSKPLGYK